MSDSKVMGIIEFANHCGVSKQAVSNACKKGRLPLDAMGKLDSDHPDCLAYYEKHNGGSVTGEDIGAGAESETGGDIRDQFTSGKTPAAPAEIPAVSKPETPKKITRRELEMRKLEMQGDNFELKNKQMRGSLANVKFYDQMFHTQLGIAVKNFMALPNACIDDIGALYMDKGADARAEAVTEMTERINEILESVEQGWSRSYDRAQSDLTGIIDDE